MACAISVKWNGAYGALGLAVIFFIGLFEQIRDYKTCCRLPDKPNWTSRFMNDYVWKLGILCVFSFIIVPAIIYFSTFIPLMNVTDGTPYTFNGILDLQEYMKWFHTGRRCRKDPSIYVIMVYVAYNRKTNCYVCFSR